MPDLLDAKRTALAEAMVVQLGDHYQVEWGLIRNMPEPVLDRLLDQYSSPVHVG